MICLQLTSRNRKLRAIHVSLGQDLRALLHTDLLKQRAVWIDQLTKLQSVFNKEQRCVW